MTNPTANETHVRRNPLGPTGTAGWRLRDVAAAYLVGNVLSGAVLVIVGESGRATTVWDHVAVLAGVWVGMVGGAILVSRHRGSGYLVRDYRILFRPIDTPIGAVVGIALQVAIVPFISWPITEVWDLDISRPARDLLDIAGPRWLLYACVIIGAPIVEEIFFRGLLLRTLASRVDDRVAVIVSAAIFAGTHFQLAQFPGLFAVGLTLAELVRRTGRLGPAIAAHVAFNAAAVTMLT